MSLTEDNTAISERHPCELEAEDRKYRPFDRIPIELLSHILTLTWLSYAEPDSLDRFSFPSAPSRVNRYFNRAVLSTPILWSYLRVSSKTDMSHIEERIQRRSGALPLDVSIVFRRVPYQDAKVMVEKTIIRALPRCRTITLAYATTSIVQIPPGRKFWDHLSPLNEHGPLPITSFHVISDSRTSRAPLDFLPPVTPLIRSLKLAHCDLVLPRELPGSLEVLEIQDTWRTSFSTSGIGRCLGGSLRHSLRSLALVGMSVVEGPGDTLVAPCILESLEVFQLRDFHLQSITLLLSHIVSPNLRHLALKTIYGTALSDALIPAWRSIRLSKLHKITIQGFAPYNTDRLIDLMQNLPTSIECLEVVGDGPVEALLHPSTARFCNQIQHLIADELPLDGLISLLKKRRAPLRTLNLGYQGALDEPSLSRYPDQRSTYRGILENSAEEFTISGDHGVLSEVAKLAALDGLSATPIESPGRG